MDKQGRALDVILELMHGEMVRLQDLCLEAQTNYLEELKGKKLEKAVWISVNDSLPEDQKVVLAVKQLKDGRRDMCLARCLLEFEHYEIETGTKVKRPYWVCGGNNNIIYWMPLPEMPEEAET